MLILRGALLFSSMLLIVIHQVSARPQIPAFITRWWHGPGWINPAKTCARVSGQTLHQGPAIIEARIETFRNPAGKDYDDSTCDNNAISWAIEALNTDDCDTRVYMHIDTEQPAEPWPQYDSDWKVVIEEWDDGNNIYYARGSPNVGEPMYIDTVDKDVASYTMANIRVKLTDVDDWTFENVINKFNCYYDSAPAEAECLAKWRSVKCCTAISEMDDDVSHTLTISVRSYRTGNDHRYCNMQNNNNNNGRTPGNVDLGRSPSRPRVITPTNTVPSQRDGPANHPSPSDEEEQPQENEQQPFVPPPAQPTTRQGRNSASGQPYSDRSQWAKVDQRNSEMYSARQPLQEP